MKQNQFFVLFITSTIYALYAATPEKSFQPPAPTQLHGHKKTAKRPVRVAPGEEYQAFCRAEPLSVSCAPEA